MCNVKGILRDAHRCLKICTTLFSLAGGLVLSTLMSDCKNSKFDCVMFKPPCFIKTFSLFSGCKLGRVILNSDISCLDLPLVANSYNISPTALENL